MEDFESYNDLDNFMDNMLDNQSLFSNNSYNNDNFTIEDDFNNYLTKDIDSVREQYPKPTDIRISTMTAVGTLVGPNNEELDINLQAIYDYLPKELDTAKVVSIKYGINKIKNFMESKKIKKTQKERKNKKIKKTFYNQLTIVLIVQNNWEVNLKLFLNGGIQMTGVKKEQIAHDAVRNLIIGISNITYPKDDQLVSAISITKIIQIHKNNNTNTYKSIKEASTISNISINTIQNIINGKIEKKNNYKWKKEVSITSLNFWKKKSIRFINYKIVLINSDFKTGFKIDRNKLYMILLSNKYQFYATYEPGIYPGVNSKYYWNEDYINKPREGICYCSKESKCNGKGSGKGDGQCKKITIAIFQSGSIIITGGRNRSQIDIAYNYINKVLRDNYYQIKKKSISLEYLESFE